MFRAFFFARDDTVSWERSIWNALSVSFFHDAIHPPPSRIYASPARRECCQETHAVYDIYTGHSYLDAELRSKEVRALTERCTQLHMNKSARGQRNARRGITVSSGCREAGNNISIHQPKNENQSRAQTNHRRRPPMRGSSIAMEAASIFSPCGALIHACESSALSRQPRV